MAIHMRFRSDEFKGRCFRLTFRSWLITISVEKPPFALNQFVIARPLISQYGRDNNRQHKY